jgi:hypothetical protein
MVADENNLKPGEVIKHNNSNLAVVCADGNYIILEELSGKLIPPSPPAIFFELLFNSPVIDYKKIKFI